MPRETPSFQWTFGRLAAQGTDPGKIADVTVSIWRGVTEVLSSIVGEYGVAVLYARSLHLASAGYPWLASVREDADRVGEYASLQTTLSQQAVTDAAASAGALLQTFHDLLGTLIGVALTERLLRFVRETLSNSTVMQDTLP